MPRRPSGPRTSTWCSLRVLGPVLRCAIVLRGADPDGTIRCAWCSCPLYQHSTEIDHVTPRSQGGTDDRSNLVPACSLCNEGARPDEPTPEVRAQCSRPITPALRKAARALADAWYPWRSKRAEKNRLAQRARDAKRRAPLSPEDAERIPF